MLAHIRTSPSRTYIAICLKTNFNGYYFRRFKLPRRFENNTQKATWYFLNRLDLTACVDGCYTAEEFGEVKDVDQVEYVLDVDELLDRIGEAIEKKLGRGYTTYVKDLINDTVKISWEGLSPIPEKAEKGVYLSVNHTVSLADLETQSTNSSELIANYFESQVKEWEEKDHIRS